MPRREFPEAPAALPKGLVAVETLLWPAVPVAVVLDDVPRLWRRQSPDSAPRVRPVAIAPPAAPRLVPFRLFLQTLLLWVLVLDNNGGRYPAPMRKPLN